MSIGSSLGAILRTALPVAQRALNNVTPHMTGRQAGAQVLHGALGGLGDLALQRIERGVRGNNRPGDPRSIAAAALSTFGPPFLHGMASRLSDRIGGGLAQGPGATPPYPTSPYPAHPSPAGWLSA
jgi:hypothetical protein